MTSTRIPPMSADSAHAVLSKIKSNLANISIELLDGATPSQATALEELLRQSEIAHGLIVEGIAPRLHLPAETLSAENQSDWEGQRLAARLHSDWRDTAMVVGRKRPDIINGVAIS